MVFQAQGGSSKKIAKSGWETWTKPPQNKKAPKKKVENGAFSLEGAIKAGESLWKDQSLKESGKERHMVLCTVKKIIPTAIIIPSVAKKKRIHVGEPAGKIGRPGQRRGAEARGQKS